MSDDAAGKRPAKPRPVGRPKKLPTGCVLWGVRVTPAERKELKALLKQLRAKPPEVK